MKILRLFAILFLFYACSSGDRFGQILNFTDNWKFTISDTAADYSATAVADSGWQTLNLSNNQNVEPVFSGVSGDSAMPGAVAWYRKTFMVKKTKKEKQVYIDFDCISRNSEMWVNGVPVEKLSDENMSSRYNMTQYIKFGEENVIAIRVVNSRRPDSCSHSIQGIYGDVRLEIVNPIHIDQWGTYITTPIVSVDSAKINIVTRVNNTTREDLPITVQNILVDEEGKTIAKTSKSGTRALRGVNAVSQQIDLNLPHLWSVDSPYIYKVITRLRVEGNLVDEYETTFGIRSFEFTADKRFILNGKQVEIEGMCNTDDSQWQRTAADEQAAEHQLKMLKEKGYNSIRISHYPSAPGLLDLCDKMGFIVMNETLDLPGYYERDTRNLIFRDRNHPSIFIWSIGSEVLKQHPDAGTDTLLIPRLVRFINSFDPTRPVSKGCSGIQGLDSLMYVNVDQML